jgi:hypothetical protein
MALELRDITICAADCATTSLAARALRKSTAICSFGDAILFSDEPSGGDAFRHIRIEKLRSRADYSRFILKDLPSFIATPFVLIVQWDGYVLDPKAWSPDFFQYDLIGAKWPWHQDGMTVGNGGFTLRSRKLLKVTGAPSFPLIPDINEDEQICRVHRAALIRDFGIQFAPEAIADRFSYERSVPELPTFGFHGLFNLWRHVDDEEVIAISGELGPHVVRSIEFVELVFQYVRLRKFRPLQALYSRWKALCEIDEIHSQLLNASKNPAAVDYVIRVCEFPAMEPN